MESLIGALIGAIVAGGIGLWQISLTRKSLENVNRPYIIIYTEVQYIGKSPAEYLIIKNAGNVPATIDDIVYDEAKLAMMKVNIVNRNGQVTDTIYPNKLINNFKHNFLSPNQYYKIPITNHQTKFDNMQFTIRYKGNNRKIYQDIINLNLKQDLEGAHLKFEDETSSILTDILQEMLKKM